MFKLARPIFCVVLLLGVPSLLSAQVNTDRFDRQLEQIQRETDARALSGIPADKRALLDFGGYLSYDYYSFDDPTDNNRTLNQYQFVGFLRAKLDAAQELYLRARIGYQAFSPGDSFDGHGDGMIGPVLDRAFYKFDSKAYDIAHGSATKDFNFRVEAGRDLVYWGNGLTLSEVLDGVGVGLTWNNTNLELLAGVTASQDVDIDPSRPNFDTDTKRGFYGAMLSQHIGQHTPYMYGLIQRDYNGDDPSDAGGVVTNFDYNSYYLGIGSQGAITDRLLCGAEFVYEGGNNLSNSYQIAGPTLVQVPQTTDAISAFAFDGRLDYLLLDRRQTRLSTEVIVATGDDDRIQTTTTFGGNKTGTVDNAFNAFGLLNTGLAFAPAVSNVVILRVGGVTFPMPDYARLNKMQFGTDFFVYTKFSASAPIDEPTYNKNYLGVEPDFFMNWQVSSDVTIALRYGIFFPGAAIVSNGDLRQFFGAGVTYAF